MPPTLTIPPPPPALPEPQVIRVVEIPSVQVPPAKERRPSNDNLKRGKSQVRCLESSCKIHMVRFVIVSVLPTNLWVPSLSLVSAMY